MNLQIKKVLERTKGGAVREKRGSNHALDAGSYYALCGITALAGWSQHKFDEEVNCRSCLMKIEKRKLRRA